MNQKATKYVYPAGASQSAKAKIRREARAQAKESVLTKTPELSFSISYEDHTGGVIQEMIPEELAHKLLSIKNITKHFVFNHHTEGGMVEILASYNNWSWNVPVEATEPSQEQIAADKAELDELLKV